MAASRAPASPPPPLVVSFFGEYDGVLSLLLATEPAEKNLTLPTPFANFLLLALLTTPRSPSSSSEEEEVEAPSCS